MHQCHLQTSASHDKAALTAGILASYQRRLSNISKHAPILVYAVEVIDGKQGDIIYVSEALERLFGYTQAEAFAPGWWLNAIHPEDQANCIAELKNLAPGKVINLEYRMRHKEGHYIWVYNTIAVDANPETKKLEAIGVVKDISVRKAAAAQLLQTDKMASLGRMILGTAHELNQPLNFIKIAASNMREYARRGILNADRAMAKLDGILTQVDRAAAIILQMRVFNRIPQEAPIVLDIKNEIDAVVTMVHPQLELEGTRIDTSGCYEGLRIKGHPVLLEQALINLIINANDAIRSHQGTCASHDGLITIGMAQRGSRALITITDNGTGFTPEVLPMVFEPFFTTKPPKEGMGLGLPICYGIIHDLGGTIQAENAADGARFVIELPVAEED